MRRSIFWLLDHYPELGESVTDLQSVALEHSALADELGFTGLWLAEHHFQRLGTVANPAVLLAAIAQRTSRLRLGPAVSVLPLRNPILTAEDYALVDMLSGGRLNMGVGSGSQMLEFAGMGVEFESRREVFDRHLRILRERWAAAESGERDPNALNVGPLQSPSPPIYVATMNEDTALAVGLAGDSMLTMISPMAQSLSEVVGILEAHARGLDRGGHPQESAEAVVVVLAHIASTERKAHRQAVPALGRFMEALAGRDLPDPEGLYELMRTRETGLFGTADHAEQQIERYEDIGITHIALISRFGGIEAEAAKTCLCELAPRTQPRSGRRIASDMVK